jgi:hypothetical protein
MPFGFPSFPQPDQRYGHTNARKCAAAHAALYAFLTRPPATAQASEYNVILLSSEAVSDVDRVRSFLERLNPDASKRALKQIWDSLEMVEKLPSLGRPTERPEIRQIVV